MCSKWLKEKENLERLINEEHKSYEEIGRLYNVSGNAIKKACRKIGITLYPRRKINPKEVFSHKKYDNDNHCKNCNKIIDHGRNFCSNKCQSDFYYKEYIRKWKNGEVDGSRGIYSTSKQIKRYLFEKYGSQCAICKWHEVNKYSNTIPLQIHHIDGNPLNNKEENLILLCPNCHSLTNNYMHLNNGNVNTRERSDYFNRYKSRPKCEICE